MQTRKLAVLLGHVSCYACLQLCRFPVISCLDLSNMFRAVVFAEKPCLPDYFSIIDDALAIVTHGDILTLSQQLFPVIVDPKLRLLTMMVSTTHDYIE
jgi:hypothetical protein